MPTNTAEATERTDCRRMSLTIDQTKWTAHREFDIAYAKTEADCFAAMSAIGIERGIEHDLTPLLVCNQIDVKEVSINLWRGTADYVYTGGFETTADPLMQPPFISWNPALQSEPVDHTPDGVLITNTAGQFFSPSPQTDVNTWILTVEKNYPAYDPAQASQIIDYINSDTFTIKGKNQSIKIFPGMCRCKSWSPVGRYQLIAKFVPVQICFEIKRTYTLDANGFSDAWDIRLPNRGTMAWVSSASAPTRMDYIVTGDGTRVSEPVELDLDGIPLDTSYRVGEVTKGMPIANPFGTPVIQQTNVTYEAVDAPGVPGGKAYILHYPRFPRTAFAGLL